MYELLAVKANIDDINMSEVKEKSEQNETWENALIATYFFILYYGLRLPLENHMLEDRLPITLTMLLGFFSAIITATIVFIVKGKALKIKAVWAAVLLIVMIIINLLVSSNL